MHIITRYYLFRIASTVNDVASAAVTGMWTRVQGIDCHAGRLIGVMCHV